MPEMRPSSLILEEVAVIIEAKKGIIAETTHGVLLRAPQGGLEAKAIFVPNGETPEERKKLCLGIVGFLKSRGIPVRVWQELLEQEGAVIIDRLTQVQIEALEAYEPSAT